MAPTQQSCVALIVANYKYTSPYFPPIKGPENDAKALKSLLDQNNYKAIQVLEDIDDIKKSVQEFCRNTSRDPENIDVIHFHFSGHGMNNRNVEISSPRKSGNFESSVPDGECLVGCNGTLYSVKELKSDLVKMVHDGKWTISLDMCRNQPTRAGSSEKPKLKLIKAEPLPQNCIGRMATIYGAYELHVAMDTQSFSRELCALVGNDDSKSFPILDIAREINKRWNHKNIGQTCNLDLVEEDDSWKNFRWPSSNNPILPKPKKMEDELPPPPLKTKIVLLGCTGSGKSTVANIIAGKEPDDDLFPVSEKITACTFQTTKKNVQWRGHGIDLCLIDTPGLGDDLRKDSKFINNIVMELKEEQYVNTFVVVFNGQQPRFDASMKKLLNDFKKVFGPGFLKHTVILFTRWGFDQKSLRDRRRSKYNEDSRQEEFNQNFKEIGLIEDGFIPALFIDNCYDPEDEDETTEFNYILDELYGYLLKDPYSCKDFVTIEVKEENKEATWDDKKVNQTIGTYISEYTDRSQHLHVYMTEDEYNSTKGTASKGSRIPNEFQSIPKRLESKTTDDLLALEGPINIEEVD